MVDGINNVVNTYQTTANNYQSTANTTANSNEQAENAAANGAGSTANEQAGTYEPKSQNSSGNTFSLDERSAIITKLKADQQARVDSFKSLVEKIIVKQSRTDGIAAFDLDSFNKDNTLKDYLQDLINGGQIDSETVKNAQQNISEDGEFGVKKTAERILDFAKALIGDDMGNFEKIKDAVLKGFGAAEEAWGGDLPSISRQTKDVIMSAFDRWEKDGNTNYTNYSQLAQDAAMGVAK